jgi:lipid II:glycine glycyltransferase (peptidoglycan interpeptide bridge formation enzyme)
VAQRAIDEANPALAAREQAARGEEARQQVERDRIAREAREREQVAARAQAQREADAEAQRQRSLKIQNARFQTPVFALAAILDICTDTALTDAYAREQIAIIAEANVGEREEAA